EAVDAEDRGPADGARRAESTSAPDPRRWTRGMRDRADPVAIRCTDHDRPGGATPIPREEPAVAETLADILREDAIDLRLSRTAVRAELHAERACLVLDDGSRLMAERLGVATGREAPLDGLGLEALDIRPTRGGFVEVDDHCRV